MKIKIRSIATAALLTGAAIATGTGGASASSHREAPFVTKNPKVDGADFYMFNSYEPTRTGYVTLVADYVPLQDSYGGPNYFSMDPDALYEIEIDNNGDAKEDLTFQFQFQNTLANNGAGFTLPVGPSGNTKNVAVPFVNLGAVTAADTSKLNVVETYSLKVVSGDRRTGTVANVVHAGTTNTSFEKPMDYIGTKSFPDYPTYAAAHVFDIDIPNCTPPAGTHARVFVGQRDDPFAVNLGRIFDLVNLADPFTRDQGAGSDALADKNITAIELEIPASCLTAGSATTIGGWTTASVRQARVINPSATYAQPSREGGPWAQMSARLGMPLINEVIIGIPDKDRFNSSEPSGDEQFINYVTNPTLPAVVEILFGGAGVMAPTVFPRADLDTPRS